MLIHGNHDSRDSADGTTERGVCRKQHKMLTHSVYTGGQEKKLIYHLIELNRTVGVEQELVGTAEGKEAVLWQIPNNVTQRGTRAL